MDKNGDFVHYDNSTGPCITIAIIQCKRAHGISCSQIC